MRRVSVVLLLLTTLWTAPALAQIVLFGGLDHSPLGQAQLSTVGGRLKVSNLGSSGCDGVSIAVGGGNGASVDLLPLFPQELTTGMHLTADFETDAGVAETAEVRFSPDAIGGVSLSVDIWPCADPVTGLTITLYDGDEVQAVFEGQNLQNVVSVPQTPSAVTFQVVTRVRDALASKGSDSDLMYRAWLDFLPFVFATDGGGLTFRVNRIEIAAIDPGTDGAHLERLDVMAGGAAGTEMDVTETYRRRVVRRTTAAGQARVDHVTSFDADCDGTPDVSGSRSALKVSNLGSSGCDGVSIVVEDDDVQTGFQLLQPAGTTGTLALELTGTLAGGPPQVIARADLTRVGALHTLEWSHDGDPIAEVVEIYRAGTLVRSHPNASGPIEVHSLSFPEYCGTYSETDHTANLAFRYAAPIDITVQGSTTLGDEVRVRELDKSSTKLQECSVMGGGFSCPLYVTGTSNAVRLDGPPQAEPVVISALHDAEVEQTSSGRLKVSNLGSSGCDGVSIAPPDGDDIDTVEMQLGGLSTAIDRPTGAFHVETRGLLQGDTAPRFLGTLSMVSNGSSVVCTPDYSGVGTQSVRVSILDHGSLVAEFVAPDRSAVLSASQWPDKCGKEPTTGPGGQTLCYVACWYGGETFDVPGLGPVFGDEVRVIAETAIAPLERLTEWTMRLSDHEPFVFYDIILMASGVTAAPGLPQPDALLPNRPNPFNPQTVLAFDLARSGPAELVVFSLDGRRVRTVLDGSMAAGRHEVVWNGTDDTGRRVASGTYLVQLRGVAGSSARKVTLVK